MLYIFFGLLIILVVIYVLLPKYKDQQEQQEQLEQLEQLDQLEHLTTSTSISSGFDKDEGESNVGEQNTNKLCCDESSSNLSVLITNLNSKYDALASEYNSLQEQLTTNSERIQYIYDEYDSANDKLQAEMSS